MNFATRPTVAALCAALLFAFNGGAQSPPASTNALASERFLVIVETSAAMQKRAENVQKVVGSVISGGLQGQMAPNSTIGIWTFNDKLFTGQLPLQLWTPASRQRVALTMVQFLQQQKPEKISRLAVAWEAVTNVVAQSEHITVLLVTSGNDAMTGTPFDAAITESFIQNVEAQRKQNMPFLTILRAAKGQFVSYAVNMPPWPLEVPEYPAGSKPVRPAAPVEPPPVKPVTFVNPFDRVVLSPTNTIHLAETSPPVAVPIAATEVGSAAPVLAPPPTPAPKNVSAPVVVAANVEPNPTPKIAAPVAPAAAAIPPKVGDQKKFPIVTVLLAGIALLLAIMVVFIALLRWSRRSTGASLITHSMNQDDR